MYFKITSNILKAGVVLFGKKGQEKLHPQYKKNNNLRPGSCNV